MSGRAVTIASQGLLAGRGLEDRVAVREQRRAEEAANGLLVVHDQHPQVVAVQSRFLLSGRRSGRVKRKTDPPPGRCIGRDLAAVRLDDALGDRQAQARSR